MSDLIRREDAIIAVSLSTTRDSAIDTIKELPNAETTGALDDAIQEYIKDGYILAEPKVGKWISVSSFEAFGGDEICWEIRGNPTAFHYCSACKEQAYVDEFGNEILSKYCPECGAKMERSE